MAGFDIGSITATVKADTSQFSKGIDDAKKKAGEFKGNLENIGKGIGDFANKASIFTGVLTAGLVLFGKQSVEAYRGAELAQAQLEHAVIQVTKATKEQLQATEDLADALEKKGVLDGDNIKIGLAQLSTFGLSNKAVQGLGGSLADLAVNQFGVSASGEQLSQTANMIAKALNGQFGVLEKSGIRFTKLQQNIIATGTEMEKVKAINEGFAQNLKFTNDVAMKTAEGGMARLQVRIENIQEEIGMFISEALVPVIDWLTKLADSEPVYNAIYKIAGAFKALYDLVIGGDFTIAFGNLFNVQEDDAIVTFLLQMHEAFMKLGTWINENQELITQFLTALAMTIGSLVIIGTINALLMALLNPFTLVVMAIQAFFFAYTTNFMGVRDITNAVVLAIVGFFNDYLMPAISLLVQFFTENWGLISLIVTTAWDIIKLVIGTAIDFLVALFGSFFAQQVAWFKEHWDTIKIIIDSAWKIIVGIIQIASALISEIFILLTALITGNWKKAFDDLTKSADLGWAGIKNIFSGIIGFITGWGGQLLSNLVRPFQDAWNKISELVNKIKDALDFTKRHSPSVLDTVKRGVGLVNNALGALEFNTMLSPSMVAQTVSNGGKSMSIASINIDLNGAIIGNEADAMSLAERIGDGIISKLQQTVRI